MISNSEKLRTFSRAGIIAGLYAAITLVVYPYSFGPVQFRISEAMCVLPLFFPEAVPGLAVGCIITNIFSPNIAVLDTVLGTIATGLAAYINSGIKGSILKKCILAPLFNVVLNALLVGLVITLSVSANTGDSLLMVYILNAGCVAAGEAVVCWGLGVPLIFILEKLTKHLPAKNDFD